ncbi:hypothetical protein K7432_011557 [Basidiobolus ranarum]|uniref:Uncharacterized protein n=1 Tax=Basidiobolus ranarum TaxID=34480 RepID=A0ABR2WM32_9FUNG
MPGFLVSYLTDFKRQYKNIDAITECQTTSNHRDHFAVSRGKFSFFFFSFLSLPSTLFKGLYLPLLTVCNHRSTIYASNGLCDGTDAYVASNKFPTNEGQLQGK